MVNANDILNKNIIKIDGNEPFSKALSLFKDTDAIVITDEEKYLGMLLKRCLMKPKISLETKVHTQITHAPKLTLKTPIEEIARLMIENNIYHLPVIEDEEAIGIVTADDVLNMFIQHKIGLQPIKTVMSTQPLSINPEENLGKVINMFQQQDIPYLSVIDHTKVVGTITMDDIIEHLMHPDVKIKGQHGGFATEKKKKLDLLVKSIMKEEPLLMSPDSTIKDVHTHMHKFRLTGMLIGKENNLHGIVTHKELLAPFIISLKQEKIDIQFHKNTKKVSGFDKEKATHMLKTEFFQHYEKFLELGFLHVSLEQHKEVKEKLYKVTCEMKLSSQKGVFYASNYGWGPMHAMKNTAHSLEHQILKAKEK